MKRDRLFSVGAVKVTGQRIEVGHAFHSPREAGGPSASANILVHGIGGDAQVGGRAHEVVRELELCRGSNARRLSCAFRRRNVLRRHGFRAQPLARSRRARARYLSRTQGAATGRLAGAVRHRGPDRHDALGAFSTAQLLLVLIAEAKRQGAATAEELRALAGAAGGLLNRWEPRANVGVYAICQKRIRSFLQPKKFIA